MFKRLAPHLELLITVIWVGSLWTVGYLVAPTLFTNLTDRVLAGTIAGFIFRTEAWVSLACAMCLLVVWILDARPESRHPHIKWLVAAMAACTMIGYFGIQPMMAELKAAAPAGLMEGAAASRFGMLHGIASLIYLLQSVLGGWLLIKLARPR
ncbi:DUF4149 domain-containing protein [Ampullimonas aquatilis]|uniref:DUF4149 domain-containing protein n=1 Tax=Ampullimonas aquatilis TaxID=1341549 RepID=UPI003C78258D